MSTSQDGLGLYRYEPADAAGVLARERDLQAVYRVCFADPPWSESEAQIAGFPHRLVEQMAHPGAHGIIVERDGPVVAAIYGWPAGDTLPAGTAFDDALAAAAPRHVVAALTAPALVVAELMVHPAHRRQGIARALLTRYVSRWPRAWLCTNPRPRRSRSTNRWAGSASSTSPSASFPSCCTCGTPTNHRPEMLVLPRPRGDLGSTARPGHDTPTRYLGARCLR